MTNFLLEAATQRLHLNRTPTILGGDLNRPVTSLGAWTPLRNQGFVELHDHAASGAEVGVGHSLQDRRSDRRPGAVRQAASMASVAEGAERDFRAHTHAAHLRHCCKESTVIEQLKTLSREN